MAAVLGVTMVALRLSSWAVVKTVVFSVFWQHR